MKIKFTDEFVKKYNNKKVKVTDVDGEVFEGEVVWWLGDVDDDDNEYLTMVVEDDDGETERYKEQYIQEIELIE